MYFFSCFMSISQIELFEVEDFFNNKLMPHPVARSKAVALFLDRQKSMYSCTCVLNPIQHENACQIAI